MAKPWIAELARELKIKGHNEALEFNADRHRREVIGNKGPIFMKELVQLLQEDINALVADLKGSLLDKTTTVQPMDKALWITREGVPKINARVEFDVEGLAFKYHNPAAQWVTSKYMFHVGANDALSVRDPIGTAEQFDTPEKMAKHVMLTLFAVRGD